MARGRNKGAKNAPAFVRFWSKVDIKGSQDCWLWTAGKNNGGYGTFAFNGQGVVSHRVSWLLSQHEIPEGMVVAHKCNTPLCVNPDHLYLCTQKENIAQMHREKRDRHSRARERHPSQKEAK